MPLHEVHHNAAQHHSTSALPPISIEEYKQKGETLDDREERFDAFDGEPKEYSSHHDMGLKKTESGYDEHHPPKGRFHGDGEAANGISNHSARGREHGDRGARAPGTSGAVASHRPTDSESIAHGREHGDRETRVPRARGGAADHRTTGSEPGNPGLLNKLNPHTDSNGDGKAGFMK